MVVVVSLSFESLNHRQVSICIQSVVVPPVWLHSPILKFKICPLQFELPEGLFNWFLVFDHKAHH